MLTVACRFSSATQFAKTSIRYQEDGLALLVGPTYTLPSAVAASHQLRRLLSSKAQTSATIPTRFYPDLTSAHTLLYSYTLYVTLYRYRAAGTRKKGNLSPLLVDRPNIARILPAFCFSIARPELPSSFRPFLVVYRPFRMTSSLESTRLKGCCCYMLRPILSLSSQ